MGKPTPRTIQAHISYSRQTTEEKERSSELLKQLENALDLQDLSMMKDPSLILHRINSSPKFLEKSGNKKVECYNLF